MQPTLSFQVKPALPPALKPLAELAGNLWYAWHPEAAEMLQRIDHQAWSQFKHNPVALLNSVSQDRLEAMASDAGFLAQLERVYDNLQDYLKTEGCSYLGDRAPQLFNVAYFSAEYGLAECLPIYSGGLGMLSGDHLKSASDLNLPLVGVGLAYRQGYFTQYLNPDGWQQEEYRTNDFYDLPMELVRDAGGKELQIKVDIENRPLVARVWLVRVGRVPLYLMDAGVDANPPDLRAITHRLYGGDSEMRIRQEILLGIGGVRMLKALGIEASVFHMNEGHSAFASLERIRLLRAEKGLSFDEAREVVRASNVFTTHTPVPAGNDYFDHSLMARHFAGYMGELGISLPVLMGYGRVHPHNQDELFCMTVLALRLSAFSNGVSRLHGQVSRSMWKDVWPHFPLEDVPITHITNGVHIPSWISREMAYLHLRYLGPAWMEDPDSASVWKGLEAVPDGELWRVHEHRRTQMISYVRGKLSGQLKSRGASAQAIRDASEVLSSEVLTVVFARRFATYKRAVLLLSDLDRLAALVNDPNRPMQFIFAGKAHPRDNEGKEFIRRIVQVCQDPRFRHRLVFLEDYDMNLARHLVQGADVWLNNPRRPLEACGTSGMKAAANGALNLSVLDGWWDEVFEPGLGWPIGRGEEYGDESLQDQIEARELYRILEREVAELFYDRDAQKLPRHWIGYMKQSMSVCCPQFNTHRQVEDYADLAYLPASHWFQNLTAEDYAPARGLGAWVRKIMENWTQVEVQEVTSQSAETLTWGQELTVRARARLGALAPEDVACDLYFGRVDPQNTFLDRATEAMQPVGGKDGVYEFSVTIKCQVTGRLGVKVRVVPYHPRLSSKYALGLAAWG
ncbi:MAG: alpha-glucan family phosphorylase [Deltaproteobacteria bacterium]|nr:alpha-glucan family phosphorylase [Deltaproteobacteria bacterium]